MPNAIKYSTSAQTLALKKGNFWIGTGDVGKGPTSTTDYYNGITPPSGGYTIYLNKASGGPSIYTAANDSQLISLSNTIAGQTFASAAAALAWFATQTDKMVFDIDYPAIVTDGLIFNMDSGFTPSYPTTGTSWYDLSSNAMTGTLTNGPTYDSANNGSIVFDGVDDFVALGTQTAWNTSNALTMAAWVNITGIGGAPDIGGIITNQTTSYDLQALDANTYGGLGVNQIRITYGVTRQNPNTETYASSIENKNTWLYAVGTRYFDGTNTTIKLYINGVLKQTSSMVGAQATTSNTWVLGRYYGGRAMIGNIAVAQIYNRELSAAEIQQNYEAIGTRYTSLSVQYLVIGGGGGPGMGGGGAGGYLESTTTSLTTQTNYTITVGGGGPGFASGASGIGTKGSDSVFSTITATGGGYGGNGGASSGPGGPGGSGGGGGGYSGGQGGAGNTPSTSPSQGNNGGNGNNVAPQSSGWLGGGGGGAGGVGGNFVSTTSGNGGSGTSSSITGSAVSRAGGGAGGGNSGSRGTATSGGGNANTSGTVNTGGGGGGRDWNNPGGAGGSGIVILKIPDVYNANFSSGVSFTKNTSVSGYKIYIITATSTTSETVSFS